MLRAALVAIPVYLVAAGLSEECIKGLQHLQGESDVELAARCRAVFGPEACKQARQSLGAQPWTHTRMKESCGRFASAYQGMDARALEAAVSNKETGSVDASAQGKPNIAQTANEKLEPQDPVATLVDKLEDTKPAKQAIENGKVKQQKDQGPAGGDGGVSRLAQIFSELKKKREQAEAKEAADKANLNKQKGEGPVGTLGQLFSDLKKKRKEADDMADQQDTAKAEAKRQEPSGPLANMVKQMQEAKEAKAAKPVKLYGDGQFQNSADSSKVPHVVGALTGAALITAVAFFVASRRVGTAGAGELEENLE